MNDVHIHLLIVHLPLFGVFFGALVLGYGMWHKSERTNMAAYTVFILSAIGAAVAKFTGEGAEEAVEHIPEIQASWKVLQNSIEVHEDAGFWAFVSPLTLGVTSLGALYLHRTKSTYLVLISRIALGLSLFCLVVISRTAY